MDQDRRTAIVLWSGMVIGVVAFATVIGVLWSQRLLKAGGDDLQWLKLVAVGFIALVSPLSVILPPRLGADPLADRSTGVSSPAGRARTRLIIGMAMLEGACLFGLVAAMVTLDARLLAVVALPFVLMLGRFPSEERWAAWQQADA